jgi:hypothetical protein
MGFIFLHYPEYGSDTDFKELFKVLRKDALVEESFNDFNFTHPQSEEKAQVVDSESDEDTSFSKFCKKCRRLTKQCTCG